MEESNSSLGMQFAEVHKLVDAYDRCREALDNSKAQLIQPEVSFEEVYSLREGSWRPRQLIASVKKSLESQVESDQKVQISALALEAEDVICCAKFNKLKADLQPDPQPLSRRVQELIKEVKSRKKAAGNFSGQLDLPDRSNRHLASDLVALGGLAYLPEEVLLMILSFLMDPASIKAHSLVCRNFNVLIEKPNFWKWATVRLDRRNYQELVGFGFSTSCRISSRPCWNPTLLAVGSEYYVVNCSGNKSY